ncbi:hypothetical protein [Bradyrhizobium tropiciagri]|uniref:hypothetical protein n=1 Tax=Bradyrhizobium tropiciagri TaxID=312253 RepID=UPI00067D0490|nr:hypothetical protein [Bradyrhizobium tropiciagri]
MKKTPLILMILNGLVWGGLSWVGWKLMTAKEAQHLAGYPNTDQIGYFFAAPLLMLTASLVPVALLGQTKWSTIANCWGFLTLFAVLPYLVPYTGGV